MAEEEKVENQEAAAPASENKGSKIGLILGLLNLLLTVGIGAVVFLQFQKQKHVESVSDIQADGGEHGSAGANGDGHGAAQAEGGAQGEAGDGHGAGHTAVELPKVVSLEQFTVNLSTSPGAAPRFARVMIAVEVPSDETAQELNSKMAQVRNAIIDLFNSKRPADLQTGEGRNFLKDEIKNALNSFFVTGKVKGVFFSNFAISS